MKNVSKKILNNWHFFFAVLASIVAIGAIYYALKNPIQPEILNLPEAKSFPTSQISTIIVPHHDLVSSKRDDLFHKASASAKPKTIILASTNHYNAGDHEVQTTLKNWKLVNSIIEPDSIKIKKLVSSGELIFEDEMAFSREHGVTNILADLAKYFPDAQIIPLTFKTDIKKENLDKVATRLDEVCGNDCLLVSSIDFSHYQPGALAEIHDSLSIRSLENLNEDQALKAETDSPEVLALSIKWAKLKQTKVFHLEENTNSGKIANEPDQESTSYVFGWFEKKGQITGEHGMTFVIGGDMMFDRLIDYNFHKNLKDSVKNLSDRLFWGTDLSLVNLEGPISSSETRPFHSNMTMSFNFPPSTGNTLKWLHVNTASLANNHTYNRGLTGFKNTLNVLEENNINSVGNPSELNNNSVVRYSDGNQKISVIAINLLETDEDLVELIETEKKNDSFVIVFPHWGNEYQPTHSKAQENLAHKWIDAGADFIIGSHPHVVQDAEVYKGKPIFYSLGNLIFDQTFSKPTQRGLIVAGEILPNKIKLVIMPTVTKNLQPELLRGEEKVEIINQIKKGLGQSVVNSDYGYDIIELNK